MPVSFPRHALHAAACWLLLCVAACNASSNGTVTLKVSSSTPVTSLEFDIRDIDYDWVPTLTYQLGAHNITQAPLSVLLQPSSVIKDRFFVRVKGFDHGSYVAMDSNIFTFDAHRALLGTLHLQTGLTDADDDGFAQCEVGPLCDCNDHNDHINPFTREDCSDDLDNDCSGPPINQGCPCEAGSSMACTNLPATLADNAGLGACYFGTLQCTDGKLGSSCQSGSIGVEIPNNYIDDDCDGSVDEGSPCSQGQSRPCHLGFVDDANNPNPDERLGASKRALGVCGDANHKPFGVQACGQDINSNWVWSNCQNDVLPQRNVRPGQTGWAEIPSNATTHSLGQCDGLDNDCDGLVDDASEFDSDRDGYKVCGTDPNAMLLPALNVELVDCDDTNPKINPSAMEICGNTIDEDCRCDHDPNSRAASDPNSMIGKPSVGVDGTQYCPNLDQYLRCDTLPRSDSHPVGQCSAGPDVYYAGVYGTHQDCYACPLAFGLTCDTSSGACSQKSLDCALCAGSPPGDASTIGATRPLCKTPVAGTCRGTTGPAWNDLNNTDPFNECGQVSCTGYYDSIKNGRCYGKADVPAATVNCKTGGLCQVNSDVCPTSSVQTTPVSQPVCTTAVSGCSGSTAPSFANQPVGQDTFTECTSAYTCSDNEASGGGPFYYGIFNNICYFRANVSKNTCDGTGACQSRAEACSVAIQGGAVGGRPVCTQPTAGCSGTTAPQYTAVGAGLDPFNECAGRGCDGAGHCRVAQGTACTTAAQCTGGNCVDGFCCNSLCGGTCQACSNALTGQANGLCGTINQNTPDPGTCSGNTGCTGNNCECVANTATCKEGTHGTCNADTDCLTGHCECTNAACTARACDTVQCSCGFDSASDGTCDGNLTAGTSDTVCPGNTACNGAGLCKSQNGAVCAADGDCVFTCIAGSCTSKATAGEPCDAGDNADCAAGLTCKAGACG